MSKTCWISGIFMMLWGAAAMAQPPVDVPDLGFQPVRDAANVAKPLQSERYWLGVGCVPVPGALRAQLNLPEKQGLLIEQVAPDSPAAKAGIAKHDVLVRADGKLLTGPQDLIKAMEAAKEGKLKVELIRGGQHKTVEAAPVKRPAEAGGYPEAAPGRDDWETMENWMREMSPSGAAEGQRPPMRFRFFHPGTIVPGEAAPPAPMPSDMSVMISKEGDQPAKIVVKQGDKKWEVSEKELNKLPADVRSHVERMLGRGPLGVIGNLPSLDFVPELATPAPTAPGAASSREPSMLDRMEKRFDDMSRRMDRLLQEVEKLGESHSAPHSEAKPSQ